MLDKLLSAALSSPSLARRTLREELDRLREGGYLPEEDVEQLTRETLDRLTEQLHSTRGTVEPLLQGLGSSLREALDIPSRSEILALTEELRRQRAGAAGSGPAEAGDARGGGPDDDA